MLEITIVLYEETLAELCDAIAKGNDLNTRIWVEGN
jgi:hypothetical protein